jgi:hypothetical protein
VNISFHGSGKELAVVHIDSKWGVSDNKDLEAAIKNITGVLSLAKE